MKSYISSIGIANPVHKIGQMRIAEFMAEAVNMNPDERRRLYALYKASGIQSRYSVVPDFGRKKGEYEFFPNTYDLNPFPTVGDRMKVYEREALPLALKAVENSLEKSRISRNEITHLITVSCTGMYAPGLDLELTQALSLKNNVQRTCINYMGCYAAFNALKVADAFCKTNPDSKVLIVCVEFCTIHYQKNTSWDDILSNALFGDGAAALIVQPRQPAGASLSLESFHCDIAFEGRTDMAWNISDFGFEMTLSSYVPSLVKGGIKQLAHRLLERTGIPFEKIEYFAIHPGGKRILEVIEEELSLPRTKTQYAFDVLRDYGNMSSPSVLFVLHELINRLDNRDVNKNVMSFAFGPGLTLESMLLKVQYAGVEVYNESKESSTVKEQYV